MSDEARAEAEQRYRLWMPTGDYEIDRENYSELDAEWQNAEAESLRQAFDAGAEWQAERDAERIAELEAEVEQWRESDVALMRLVETWKPRAQDAEAEVEEWRRVAVEQTRLERDRAEAAEARITAIWHVYKDWMRGPRRCEDAEMILFDIRAALDWGDET